MDLKNELSDTFGRRITQPGKCGRAGSAPDKYGLSLKTPRQRLLLLEIVRLSPFGSEEAHAGFLSAIRCRKKSPLGVKLIVFDWLERNMAMQ